MAASPYQILSIVEGIAAVNGPTSINATLLPAVTAANYEGIWVPWLFVKQGSLEISGSFASLSCQLVGTNLISPLNSYVVTIAGSATNGDTVTLNFTTPTGVVGITVPIVTSETVTQMAAALVLGINASVALAAYGVQAINLAGVITITWPSWLPSAPNPAIAPIFTIAGAVTGGATETVAVAPGTTGSNMGSAITALGMTQFATSARWLKVRLNTLTGASAAVTATAQGTA